MEPKKLPFDISFVIGLDLPNTEQTKGDKDFYINCPICDKGANQKKLNVNDSKGVWRCNKCGSHGNALTLHSMLTGLNTKEAYKDLMKKYNGLDSDKKLEILNNIDGDPNRQINKVAPLLMRDLSYKTLLNSLNLSENHRQNLIDRGLNDDMIKKFGYKSYPAVGFKFYANEAVLKTGIINALNECKKYEKLSDNIHYQIPGFYGYGSDVKMVKRKNCFFVPVRDIDGNIMRMQIRYDNLPDNATQKQKDAFHRYGSWASSEKDDGVSVTGTGNVHFVGFPEGDTKSDDYKTPDTVYLTEGALKADIAHYLSGWAFISLMGVNSQGMLPDALNYLKKHGTKCINICFDMDYREKEAVAQALESAMSKIKEAGLNFVMIKWDENLGKGIDDFLLSKRKLKNKESIKDSPY